LNLITLADQTKYKLATNSLQYLERKETDTCLAHIVIIKLIINLISWYYYSCSACDCVSKSKIFWRAAWQTWKCIKNHTRNINTNLSSSLNHSGAFCN